MIRRPDGRLERPDLGGTRGAIPQGGIEAGGRDLGGIGRPAEKARPERNQGIYSQQTQSGDVFRSFLSSNAGGAGASHDIRDSTIQKMDEFLRSASAVHTQCVGSRCIPAGPAITVVIPHTSPGWQLPRFLAISATDIIHSASDRN
jgi:hypothetical protein